MDEPTQNSRNPANSDSLAGVFREVLRKFLEGVDDMLPAVVIAYDRTENRATVRPLIRILKTDETLLDRAQVASVPVLNIGGGDMVLSFNILPGDLGWIKASDRDISLFLQNETAKPVGPNTFRKHSFSDALFIPDQFRKWTIQPGDESSMVLQTLDGTTRIAIDSTQIRLDATDQVQITAPTVVTVGNTFQLGDALLLGTLTVTGNSSLAGKDFATHKHAGSPTAPTGPRSPTGVVL